METSNINILESVPANVSVVYPTEEYRLPVLWDGVSFPDGAINNVGAEHWPSPISYVTVPAFSNLVGEYQAHRARLDLSNLTSYGQKINCNQIHRNFISSGDGFPAAYHSQGSCEASANNSVFPYGTGIPGNFPCIEYNMVGSLMGSGQNSSTGFLRPRRDLSAFPWVYSNEGIVHSTHPRTNISPLSSMPMQQGHMQPYLPVPSHRIPSVGGQRDSRYVNRRSDQCFQDSVTTSRPFSSNKGGFLHKHQAKVSSMGLGKAAIKRIPNVQNFYRSHYNTNKVRTSPTESITNPQTVMGSRNAAIKKIFIEQSSYRSQYGPNKVQTSPTQSFSNPHTVVDTANANGNSFSGKTGRHQWNQLSLGSRVPKPARHQGNQLSIGSRIPKPARHQGNQLSMGSRIPKPAQHQGNQLSMGSRVLAPHAKKSGIQKSLGSYQVWRRKATLEPSTTPSKASSKQIAPKHHIQWKGFAELVEPVGEICQLCDRDFAYAPNDYDSDTEYESALLNLPSVSILPCGHAYHSECLQLDTPEEKSRDPLCPICASFETI